MISILRFLPVFIIAFSCSTMAALAGDQPVIKPTVPTVTPSAEVIAKVDYFLPQVVAWYVNAEAELLPQGRPLSAEEKAIAKQLGIKQPDQVRIVVNAEFPLPQDEAFRHEAELHGLGSILEGGRTMGYAILLKPSLAENRTIIAHELVHVGQIERLGKEGFLRQYLTELETVGYENAPLEREAYDKQTLFE